MYFDHAATTPVLEEVLAEMMPYFVQKFGNAATHYTLGEEAAEAILVAREKVADLIGAEPNRIFFTSGGTESDNWALVGTLLGRGERNHLVYSSIEHHAVTHSAHFLREHHQVDLSEVPVDSDGLVQPSSLESAVSNGTALVSIMYANNEIGTIQDLKTLSQIAHNRGAYFHTDAVQAAGKIPIDVDELGVDLLSLSAHKFYGPKGVGALYIREGIEVERFMNGGAQELEMRAGTSNTPGIVGMGAAAKIARDHLPIYREKAEELTSLLESELIACPGCILNIYHDKRVPGVVSARFNGIEAEEFLEYLSSCGVSASSGSACNCDDPKPSHVLKAIGLSDSEALSTLRFTLGRLTGEDHIRALSGIIQTGLSSGFGQ